MTRTPGFAQIAEIEVTAAVEVEIGDFIHDRLRWSEKEDLVTVKTYFAEIPGLNQQEPGKEFGIVGGVLHRPGKIAQQQVVSPIVEAQLLVDFVEAVQQGGEIGAAVTGPDMTDGSIGYGEIDG